MSNLPITLSTPQAAAKPAQPTQSAQPAKSAQAAKPVQPAQVAKPAQTAQDAAESADGAAQGSSFGDVLARQMSDAVSPEEALPATKNAAQSAGEALAKLKADDAKLKADDAKLKADGVDLPVVPADALAALPADMLAALMPQGMAATVSVEDAAGLPKQAGSPVDEAGVTGLSKHELAAGTTGQDDLRADKNISAPVTRGAGTAREAAADAKKEAAFTSMLASMNATTANKAFAADEKSIALAAAPQPNAGALASMQATPASLNPASVMPAQVAIHTPVTHENWGEEFNQKITWLASSKEQSAELHLNPPQLGPMDVVLKVSGDQATALFTSPHAAVREAIEQALPKLREMFAESGIMLGNATVNDQAPRGRDDGFEQRSKSSRGGVGGIAESAAAGDMSARVSPISRHNGIVDTFA